MGEGTSRVETGAVTGVHRAGASLNVHVHFHVLCLDGVYRNVGDRLRFEPAPAPTRAELTWMLQHIYDRVMKWLSRRGLLHAADVDASNEARELLPAEALAAAGMARGTVVTTRDGGDADEPVPTPPRARRTPPCTSASTCTQVCAATRARSMKGGVLRELLAVLAGDPRSAFPEEARGVLESWEPGHSGQ